MKTIAPFCLLVVALLLTASTPAPGDTTSPPPTTDYTLAEVSDQIKNSKGSVVMFHLYASFCPPCREEFPAVIRLAERYKNHPFKMMAYSCDTNLKHMNDFLQGKELGFERARLTRMDRQGLSDLGMHYDNRIPYTALFDGSGKVIKEWSGARDYSSYCTMIDDIFLSATPTAKEPPTPSPVAKTATPAPKPEQPVAKSAPSETPPGGSSGWLWLTVCGVGSLGAVGLVIGLKHHRRS